MIFLSILTISCSGESSPEENSGNNEINTLEVQNVYVLGEPKGWTDIVVTDGEFVKGNDEIYYPKANVTYMIDFLELQLGDGMDIPKVLEQNYDPERNIFENKGTEGVIFYNDFKFKNAEYQTAVDLYDIQGYVRFEVISQSQIEFYIELQDGRKFQGSFNGNITILDKEYSFAPDALWDENTYNS